MYITYGDILFYIITIVIGILILLPKNTRTKLLTYLTPNI